MLMLPRNFILLFALLLLGSKVYGRSTKSSASDDTSSNTGSERKIMSLDQAKKLLPVELTSKNFGSEIGDGNTWLIKFYAPWCSHCKEVMPTWEEVAIHFHQKPDKHVKVGKVDGDSERALTSRFGVTAYPSFYLIKGFRVFKYDGSRHKLSFIDFVESGYKKASPIPFLSSPMGPLGLCQGVFLWFAYRAYNTLEWMKNDLGFSSFFAVMFLFGSTFISIFFAIVVAAIALTPKDKRD